MKKGALAAGIILLVIGSMGYLMTTQSVSQGQTVRGEVERFFSSGSQNQYQQAGFAQLIFGGLAVVGFVLTIYGSAAKSNHTKTTSSEFYCKYCSQPFPTYLGMNKHRENCEKKP
ncbi:MAG: hypothetical protein O6761_08540, partial [Thaumarchaeota archaeon]|nr:hypothetical protein [Nitrososphaerota archaeon]